MTSPNPSPEFGQLEQLVQQLYNNASSPQDIARVQRTLQSIQRSPRGWLFADELLHSNDDQVRFFGALTFTIKIKSDWDTLSLDEASSVLDKLLLWLVRLANCMEKPFITKKICGSLVAYFLRPTVSWRHCVRHLLCCFGVGGVMSSHAVSQHMPTAELVFNLEPYQLKAALWFSTILVEELGQTSLTSPQTFKDHESFISDLEDLIALLRNTLNFAEVRNLEVTIEGVKCFQALLIYADKAWSETALELGPIQALTPFLLEGLTDAGISEAAADFFMDTLTRFPAFFTPSDLSSLGATLSSPIGQNHIVTLRAGVFDRAQTTYARLLLAYGEATVQSLATNCDQASSVQILRNLVDLLGCGANPGADEDLCSQCLEFWSSFAQFLVDSTFAAEFVRDSTSAAGDEVSLWMNSAKKYIPDVIRECWVKICIPRPDVFASWDRNELDAFKELRLEVKDFLESSYALLGRGVFEEFAHLALEYLTNHAWLHLEATIFCLNALSESISTDESVDEALSKIFGSSLFTDMTNSRIPASCRLTVISLITSYTAFCERNSNYLPAVLNFLFESVKTPDNANAATKAIYASCWACRKALVAQLGAFLHQYRILLTWQGVEASTKEKVLGAIAAVAQAIPAEEERLDYLDNLLEFVERDVQESLNLLEEGRYEEGQTHRVCALRCLVNMGKAFQVPDDVAIDLEAKFDPSTLWAQGTRISLTQARIVQLIEIVTKSGSGDSPVMEAACQILRTGYQEITPGPFVFPPLVTENLVLASNINTPRLDYLLSTAGSLLFKHRSIQTVEIRNAADAIFIHLLNLIHQMDGDPSFDPEVASSCLDLADKYTPYYFSSFLKHHQAHDEISFLLLFSLRCLTAAEIMPKRSAATFWASLGKIYDLPEDTQGLVEEIMRQWGPGLSLALIMSIGGEAARSELDILAEPLKRLVKAQVKAKQWLADALEHKAFPSKIVTTADKRIWLQKIINQRGGPGTNQLVKDFWMACRGTNLSFG